MSNIFPEIISIIDRDSVSINNFKVFFCNLKNSYINRIKYIINKCSKIIHNNSFTELLYGRIIVCKHLIGRPRACYSIDSDSVKFAEKIAYNKNYKSFSIKSMLHELGHRAYFKDFISREKCKVFYNIVKEKNNKQYLPSKYCLKNDKEWFAEIFSYGYLYNNSIYKDFVNSIKQ